MAAKKAFNAQGLRAILAFLLVAVVLGGACLFYLGLNTVRDFSATVNHSLQDADTSSAQVTQLQLLKGQLSNSEALGAKADSVFASPSNYQGQASNDLKVYANQTGLRIASIDYDDPSKTGAYSLTLSLKDPVSYSKLVQFLGLIEGNLPKLQVSELSLGHKPLGNADDIQVNSIKINVAVR